MIIITIVLSVSIIELMDINNLSVFETTFLDYFFRGVAVDLAVGEVAGLAFVSGFFSSFEGLAVDDGLAVVAGEATTAGVAVGVALAGLLFAPDWQAPKIAAMAAKIVSRNDLLIVFSSNSDRVGSVLSGQPRSSKPPPPITVSQPEAAIATDPAAKIRSNEPKLSHLLQHCDR